VRTTVRLDDELLTAAKRRAAETGRTLTAVIEDALRRALARPLERARPARPLPTFTGNGPRGGVDLDDSAALLELMDGTG
jgi:Arc/MetJ family transcription regulator